MNAKDMPRVVYDRCKFIPELVKGLSVLDIGCVEHNLDNRKRGHWLHDRIKQSASSILGLDYEKEEIEKLKNEGYNVVAADATNFNLGRAFGAIVAGELIEHVTNAKGFLDCAAQHMTSESRLIMTTPNANSLIYFAENLLLGHEIDNPDHVCLYSATTMGKLLDKCGFSLEAVVYLAENTSYCHTSMLPKLLVQMKQLVQVTLAFFRPSICHHMIIVAKKK